MNSRHTPHDGSPRIWFGRPPDADPTRDPRPSGAEPLPNPAPNDWELRLRETMLAKRIVSIRGDLDEALAGQVALELMSLDASGDEHVTLYVDSGGGTLEAAFIVVDVIDLLGVPVHATCLGRAEGPAAAVVAVADNRFCAPHARFRLCEPVSEAHGIAVDMRRFADQQKLQLARFVARIAEATGRPVEHVEADVASGRFLDAHEALEYGLVDEIWTPTRNQGDADRDRGPLGFQAPPRRHLQAYQENPPRKDS
jgi:ATP-dependent Clp protease, protease subunit